MGCHWKCPDCGYMNTDCNDVECPVCGLSVRYINGYWEYIAERDQKGCDDYHRKKDEEAEGER